MTREECIDGLQKIVEFDKNKILVRVHVGFLIHAIKFMKEHETIVRCKDCKYWKNKYKEYDVHPWLPCMEINTSGNWFCAYGEKDVKLDE